MIGMEQELQKVVVVLVGRNRPTVDPEAAAAVLRATFNVDENAFSIRRFSPGDFLVLCATPALKQQMVDAAWADGALFSLLLKPWNRQLQATSRRAPFRLELELGGIPGQAWDRRAADTLFAASGWVESVHPSTISRSDMSSFRLTLWSFHPELLPDEHLLSIPEPDTANGSPFSLPRRSVASVSVPCNTLFLSPF